MQTEKIVQNNNRGICTLCACKVSKHPILDESHAFCCVGCQAVFNILSVRNECENFRDNPLFQQAVRSGLISNPVLLEQIRQKQCKTPDEELEKIHIEVEGLWCPSCAEVIRLTLLQEKGVKNCVIDYATDLGSIEYSPRHISKDKIFELIRKLGYSPLIFQSVERKAMSSDLYLRFIVAAFFSLNIMMFSYPIYATYFTYDDTGYSKLFVWLSFAASLPVVGYCAVPILRRFWTGFKVGILGMEALIVMGISTAFGLSVYELFQGGKHVYFDSMSVIITFVLLGKIIESKAKFSAKDSLLRISRAIPKRGRKRFEDGSEKFVSIKEIDHGDILLAFNGEKIVLDGVVVEGKGSCDESVMTGEAIPVRKENGSAVLGGTILSQGCLAYRVTATGEETALHKIFTMVEQDISHKTVYTRAVDTIVPWFVPLVMVIAALTAMISFWNGNLIESSVVRAVSVLLISCPCAIGIAAPLAESQILNGLANLGAIVRNRGCLTLIGKETVFIFDKTGTITEGQFHVLEGLSSLSTEERRVLKGLASQSNHPVACAISQAIVERGVKLENIEEFAGKGIQGEDNGNFYYLGSTEFMRQKEINNPIHVTEVIDQVVTVVFFAKDDRILACLTLGDQIKDHAKEVVASLKPVKTVLLSGDAEPSTQAVARLCGFDEWKSKCSPLEKRDYIDNLRKNGEVVCMMGDGINDAPALTGSNIGISVVTATDISIQVSDIMLTTDRLQVVPKIRSLAAKGHRIVYQNLFWAFFYNLIGIGLAVSGYLSPIFSAAAMVASSLIVLFNSRRI
ncbi:MAG: putative copper-importing P-type ATPase A [Chlamydiae bacterium]|nr:putative copper-importing P-type ATPase A [Chlamydiota bacterium]